jgi:hypothetical protein
VACTCSLDRCEFDAVTTTVTAWRNGTVDLEVQGMGGPNDGKVRTIALARGEGNALLIELAKVVGART